MFNSRSGLFQAASALALIAATPAAAYAQQRPSIEFNIPAQSLGSALRSFGSTAGEQVVFDEAVVSNLRSAALTGDYSTNEALRRLLADTGLTYRRTARGVISISGGSAVSRPGPQAAAGAGALTGQILDGQNMRRLAGAIVRIEGTNQVAVSDDNGEFRFSSAPAGENRITVQFIGYPTQSRLVTVETGRTANTEILFGVTELEEVIVSGQRSARALALNRERTAENSSSVVSSDALGQFTGTTIAESLRRTPGVSFQRSRTGEGSAVNVRGVGPDMNAITFNGVELPEASGRGRTSALNNILTESISQVTINKTLLPSHDSAGAGGLIEIETMSPLDRPHRQATFAIEGARADGQFNNEFIASGTVSHRFGASDEFGLSASLQYRERDVLKLAYTSDLHFGRYLPLQIDGQPSITSLAGVDPRRNFPFESGGGEDVFVRGVTVLRDQYATSNLSATLSAAWQIGDHTRLSLDYQLIDQDDELYSDQSAFTPAVNQNALLPVVELGGQQRRTLRWNGNQVQGGVTVLDQPDNTVSTDILTFRGETKSGPWITNYSAAYTSGRSSADAYNAGGSYQLTLNASHIDPAAIDPIEGRILSPFGAGAPSSIPVPLLTEAGFAFINNPANLTCCNLAKTENSGSNERLNGHVDVRRSFGGEHFRYIETGLSYERSDFSSYYQIPYYYLPTYDDFGTATSLGDLGFTFTQGSLAEAGVTAPYSFLDRARVVELLRNGGLDATVSDCDFNDPSTFSRPNLACRVPADIDPRLRETRTRETEFAFYTQLRVDIGNLELIGGFRASHVELEAVNLATATITNEDFTPDTAFNNANITLVNSEAAQTTLLPRILANYRFDDNMVLRAGYYQSIARPQIDLLSSNPLFILSLFPLNGPTFDKPMLQVVQGNPDLEPASTHSFDLNFEYYDDRVGIVEIGAFYKKIDNLLESNVDAGVGSLSDVTLPDDPRYADVLANPDNYYIEITTPVNNDSPAHIWGFELNFERQFPNLPGVLSGLGVIANYTYTESSKEQPVNYTRSPVLDSLGNIQGYETRALIFPGARFNQQPTHSGTLGVSYDGYGIEANLAYTAQSRRQQSFAGRNLSLFEEAYDTLDLHAEYRFEVAGGRFRLSLEGLDLLRGSQDPGLINSVGGGDEHYRRGASYFGGRQVRVGLSATF